MGRFDSFVDPANSRSVRASSLGAFINNDSFRSISSQGELHPTVLPKSSLSIASRPHPESDPLGLQVVSDPDESAGDIIFVHGLGGSAWRTWSWQRKTENFWPAWLANDEHLRSFRVLTFGYNSNFKGDARGLDVADFAKDLLLQMFSFPGGLGREKPILFVAHSMGGLVVKKAYILGKQDKRFSRMVARVTGIVFLATPHRGSRHAKTLNNILATAPLAPRPKAYIATLDRQSAVIQDINEVFSHQCEALSLVSFYETLCTSLSRFYKIIVSQLQLPRRKTRLMSGHDQIVEKNSAVLGYGNEMSAPMHADHNSIAKYENEFDSNFLKVKDTLRQLLPKFSPKDAKMTPAESIKAVEGVLGILNINQNELYNHRQLRARHSGSWLSEENGFAAWLHATTGKGDPRYYWLFGLPGSGKTVLSAAMVDRLRERGSAVQYHFFSEAHQAKRTIAYGLRSIATQLALTSDSFLGALIDLHQKTGVSFTQQNQDFHAIWKKIFEGIIFRHHFSEPLVWVFDGVDESDAPDTFLNQMSQIDSCTPIKVFFSSRPLKAISRFGTSQIRSYFLRENDTADDIREYAARTLRRALPDDEDLLQHIVTETLKNSSGSFLWVKLALDALQENWHTRDMIRQSLTEVPQGMTSMYERMLGKVQIQGTRSRTMAQRILMWATCSWRPLRLAELEVALRPDFSDFTNLEDTVTQICGNFVSISPQKQVTLIHKTARDFLSKGEGEAFGPIQDGHCHIAVVCLKHLSSDHWRRHFDSIHVAARSQLNTRTGPSTNQLVIADSDHPLLSYAACNWAYHVSKSPANAPELLNTLKAFLSKYLLSWIEAVSLTGSFRYLIETAQYLNVYAKTHMRALRQQERDEPSLIKSQTEHDVSLIRHWATDIIRIVGRFGTGLLSNPPSIYSQLAPFCPRDSMIGSSYMSHKPGSVTVTGLRRPTWDDCLASVNVGSDEYITQVLATEMYFITLVSSTGTVIVWDADTCEQLRVLCSGGYVPLMRLNKAGTAVATVTLGHFTVWELSTGKRLFLHTRTLDHVVLDMSFGSTDSELWIGFGTHIISRIDLTTGESVEDILQLPEDSDFCYQGSPWRIAFSPDLKRIAAAWRGRPPLIWDIVDGTILSPRKCRVGSMFDSICAPQQLQWHPDTHALFILSQNMQVVEWRVFEDQQKVYQHLNAAEITISEDGNWLLSRDNRSTTSVWSFPQLNLVYSLISEGNTSTNLAFSPGGQRFYDARGSFCMVWEPDALIRADERDTEDISSTGETIVLPEPRISHFDPGGQFLSAFATDFRDRYYCCGNEDGEVYIHNLTEGKRLRKVYRQRISWSVINLSWSMSGKYMVSYDISGFVTAKRLRVKEEGTWAVFPVINWRLGEPVDQFVFSSNEQFLLIAAASTVYVWDLKTKQEVYQQTWSKRPNWRWIQHPQRRELVIRIEPTRVQYFTWPSLGPMDPDAESNLAASAIAGAGVLPVKDTSDPNEAREFVVWALATGDNQSVVYATLPGKGRLAPSLLGQGGFRLGVVDVLKTQDETENGLHGISQCAHSVAEEIKHPLGIYKNSLVFLDHDCWVCTWAIQDGTGNITRHFFIPKDWMTDSAYMATVNAQGTFCCPRFGEVAIVRNGIRL